MLRAYGSAHTVYITRSRSTILTTNQPLSKWGDVFGDYTIANAIIDRLVHHSSIIKITGQSYRIKDKLLYDEDTE